MCFGRWDTASAPLRGADDIDACSGAKYVKAGCWSPLWSCEQGVCIARLLVRQCRGLVQSNRQDFGVESNALDRRSVGLWISSVDEAKVLH